MKQFVFHHDKKEYTIKIGSNATNNWELLDSANTTDILFHVHHASSSYVILQNEEFTKLNQLPRQVVKRCSSLCKSHSSSKTLQNVPIIYTIMSDCKKGDTVGSVIMQNIKQCFI